MSHVEEAAFNTALTKIEHLDKDMGRWRLKLFKLKKDMIKIKKALEEAENNKNGKEKK